MTCFQLEYPFDSFSIFNLEMSTTINSYLIFQIGAKQFLKSIIWKLPRKNVLPNMILLSHFSDIYRNWRIKLIWKIWPRLIIPWILLKYLIQSSSFAEILNIFRPYLYISIFKLYLCLQHLILPSSWRILVIYVCNKIRLMRWCSSSERLLLLSSH